MKPKFNQEVARLRNRVFSHLASETNPNTRRTWASIYITLLMCKG